MLPLGDPVPCGPPSWASSGEPAGNAQALATPADTEQQRARSSVGVPRVSRHRARRRLSGVGVQPPASPIGDDPTVLGRRSDRTPDTHGGGTGGGGRDERCRHTNGVGLTAWGDLQLAIWGLFDAAFRLERWHRAAALTPPQLRPTPRSSSSRPSATGRRRSERAYCDRCTSPLRMRVRAPRTAYSPAEPRGTLSKALLTAFWESSSSLGYERCHGEFDAHV